MYPFATLIEQLQLLEASNSLQACLLSIFEQAHPLIFLETPHSLYLDEIDRDNDTMVNVVCGLRPGCFSGGKTICLNALSSPQHVIRRCPLTPPLMLVVCQQKILLCPPLLLIASLWPT